MAYEFPYWHLRESWGGCIPWDLIEKMRRRRNKRRR